MASINSIPDLSSTPLYAAVVAHTSDDPRLLALWCYYAIWAPIDEALGQQPDLAIWSQRTLLAPEVVTNLTRTLIERGLLVGQATIPRWSLQEASWKVVADFSNEVRRRAGIAPLPPRQATLPELGGRDQADATPGTITRSPRSERMAAVPQVPAPESS